MTCEHCAELEEQVRQLERQLYNREWEAPAEFRLTPLEQCIVATLVAANGRACSADFLIDATRAARHTYRQNPTSNLNFSKVCHTRAKLKPFGLTIETVWGTGFRISTEMRARLLNWSNQEAAA